MIKHIRFEELGTENYGWLQTRYHFSFAAYYNPQRMGFGKLRVINDDIVAAGHGFDPHPHKNMEIISYIRSGSVSHEDSEGNKGLTETGEVQVMSAGTGIMHSEYNLSEQPLTLYQIWIETDKPNVQPRWESKKFSTTPVTQKLPLLVSGFAQDKDSALFIHQQARIFGGCLKQGSVITQEIAAQAYVLASKGQFIISDRDNKEVFLNQGDGAQVTETDLLTVLAVTDCELVIIDVPS
ncbi:pirin family protein [Psychromonas ossibalaenae]|uniref:pirin family protein n=1 Tax=Psychromonas ossibalaenae TaxID=444922 RepID=UPI00039E4D13|nr:pirin-like bicupin family protein [Psychromonas ossibalaenae]